MDNLVKVVADRSKPIWEVSNNFSAVRNVIENKIAESKEIEALLVPAAMEGLNADMTIFTKQGPKVVKDYRTRLGYLKLICEIKGWARKSDINIDARLQQVNITREDEEILRRYTNES